jgi:Flp pilus assembly protein CpaB
MTDHWLFVTAAYLVTAIGTGGVLAHSWWSMRSAERAAEEMRRR